jgi:hypothetical protein
LLQPEGFGGKLEQHRHARLTSASASAALPTVGKIASTSEDVDVLNSLQTWEDGNADSSQEAP